MKRAARHCDSVRHDMNCLVTAELSDSIWQVCDYFNCVAFFSFCLNLSFNKNLKHIMRCGLFPAVEMSPQKSQEVAIHLALVPFNVQHLNWSSVVLQLSASGMTADYRDYNPNFLSLSLPVCVFDSRTLRLSEVVGMLCSIWRARQSNNHFCLYVLRVVKFQHSRIDVLLHDSFCYTTERRSDHCLRIKLTADLILTNSKL